MVEITYASIIIHMTTQNITFIFEENNPELFEIDEAGEMAFYAIQQMLGRTKDQWKVVDSNFPDDQKLYTNMGFLGTTVILDKPILSKFSAKIRPDMRRVVINFIVGKNLEQAINSWGFANNVGDVNVNVLFTAKTNMSQIRQELTRTLVHELNHVYDFYDFSKNNKVGNVALRNDALNKMYNDIAASKKKIEEFIKLNKLQLDQNYIEFLDWLMDFNELKSLSKEVIYELNYRSIPFTDPTNPRIKSIIISHLMRHVVRNNANKANLMLTRGVIKTTAKYIAQFMNIYNQRLITPAYHK